MQVLKEPTPKVYRRTPCNLAELMELYEANYLRLRVLLPDLSDLGNGAVSLVPDCMGLYLKVLERCKYTTTLLLHYRFSDTQEPTAPHTQIRVYHDARIAEAMAAEIHTSQQLLDVNKSLKERWRRNRFLYRWLGYCLKRGHKFKSNRVLITN